MLGYLLACALPLGAQMNITTYQYDNTRAGTNLNEKALTPRNVNSAQFGRLFRQPVDGSVYAQPLYLSHVKIEGKGVHNVVYVTTEHDSVYAFDANDNSGANASPLWQTSFIDPAKGITAVPSRDYLRCPAIEPEIGITSTSVIDPEAGTLYVEAMTKESEDGTVIYVHRLHVLDVTTGKERPGSPVKIEATVPGSGDGTDKVVFTAKNQKQRPGLLLVNGVVYTAWSSQCERLEPFHGGCLGTMIRLFARWSCSTALPTGLKGLSGRVE